MRRSILDRLTAWEGASRTAEGRPDEILESIRRDLEELLNTRNHFLEELGDEFPEAAKSVVGYGVPDTDDCLLSSSEEIEELRQRMMRAVEVFEPRLENVQVAIIEAPRRYTQEVLLEIRASVRALGEPIVWSSTLNGGVVTVSRDG